MESVKTPEITPVKPTVEETHTREDVKQAFRGTFDRYKSAYESGRLDAKPELKWKFVGTKETLEKTLDKRPPRTTLDNEFHSHPDDPPQTYNQKEGIPVDGLLEFTQQEIDSLPDGAEKDELIKQRDILNKESRSYTYSPTRREPGRLVARVTQEANLISVDPILQPIIQQELRTALGREPTPHEIVEANWYRGIGAITTRRELVMPAPQKKPDDDGPPPDGPPVAPPPEEGDEDDPPVVIVEPPVEPPVAPPPVDTIDNLRIQGTLINSTDIASQRAQADSQKNVDEKMRQGRIWEIWKLPKKALVRMQQSYLVERGRQKLLEGMARTGTTYLTTENAKKAIGDLTTEREKEKADTHSVLKRFASGAVTSEKNARGERIVEVTNQELRQKMVDQILKPMVDAIKSGTPLTPEQIQANLQSFAKSNLKDHPELREFFGPDANSFGELAKVFATDMENMAQQTVDAMTRFNKTLGELDQYIHFKIANARGFDTEQRGMIARWVASARRRESYREAGLVKEAGGRAGLLLNPFVVGVGASLGLQGLMMLGRKEAVVMGGLPTLGVSAIAGGLAAGIRRNSETWADYRRHMFERESSQDEVNPKKPGGIGGRIAEGVRIISGGSSREDLEKIRSNLKIASAKHLIEGGTTDVATGVEQKSIADLLASTDTEQIAGRIAEIQARQKFGVDNKIALISYSNAQQGISDIEIGRYELQQRLDSLMTSPQAAQDEINRLRPAYDRAFTTSKEQAEKAFTRYRLVQSVKAGAFGSLAGVAGGYVSHEAMMQITQHGAEWAGAAGGFLGVKPTVAEAAEMVAPTAPIEHAAAIASPPVNRDVLKGLFQHPGNLKLPNGMVLAVDGQTHHASILDQWGPSGRPLPLPPMNLTENGSIVMAGNPDIIPEDVKQVMGGWEVKASTLPEYNLYNHIEEAVKSGQHEGFAHGNLEVDMNSGENGQMSMRVLRELGNPDSGVHVHGFAHLDADGRPIIDIDHGSESNLPRTPEDWQFLHDEMKKNGWNIAEETVPGTETTIIVDKPVLGPEGEWTKHTTEVKREWYAYNTPYSEKNELMQYSMDKQGTSVSLDMSKMTISEQAGLNPPKIDVQEVIKNHQAVWAMSLPGQEANPMLISDGADGVWDGKLTLDPNDMDPTHVIETSNGPMQLGEFAKILVNQDKLAQLPDGDIATEYYTNIKGENRLDVWRLNGDQEGKFGLISAGTVTEQDGEKVFKSFATIRGTGQTPDNIEIRIEKVTPPYMIDHMTPPPAVEFVPPPAPPETPPPFIPWIPTDFAPRNPLQPLKESGGIYYGYYEPMSQDRLIMFEANRSRSLKENPRAILDPHTETQEYFDRQNPIYRQEIINIAENIGEPISPETKAIICIPVAGHEEGEHIYASLKNYTYQTADPKTYEILLFVNHPEGTTLDKTMDEITRFKHDFPNSPVRTIYKQLPRADAKMAVIRKYLNDVALYRHNQRGAGAGDIILISNDADNKGVSPDYVENFVERMGNDKARDGLVGQIDWDPESYVEYPAIHAGTRLFQYLNILLFKGKHGDRPSSGANFALRGSIYAGIGGYQINDMPGAEDVILGQAIRAARGGSQTLGYAGAGASRIYTSSRRAVDAWNKGYAPIEQWDRGWGAINNEVRRLQLGIHKTVNYKDPNVIRALKGELEEVIDRTLKYYQDAEGNLEGPLFKRAVGFLGIDYGVDENGKIKINSMSKFLEGIKRYQKEGLELQQIKSGKPPTTP